MNNLILPLTLYGLVQTILLLFTIKNLKKMDERLQALGDSVSKESRVTAAAVALLNGLSAQLTAALSGPFPVQVVQDIVTQINDNTDALSAAIVANTQAAPAPTVNDDANTGMK